MTLDASGVLSVGYTSTTSGRASFNGSIGVGTTAPLLNSSGNTVHINTSTAGHWSLFHATTAESGAGGADGTIYGQIGLDGYVFNYETGAVIFGTSGTERARIDSSGNLIQTVNTTAATLSTNNTLTFSIVDNSTLRISVRGSDGTIRTATVALT
jgi:hypothetical protein